jgi:predicted nucleic acid-binding protein
LPRPGGGSLSEHERSVLAGLGIDPDRTARSPLVAGVLRRRQLEHASSTTEQVAQLLGREPSRIRQRLQGERRSLASLAHGDVPDLRVELWPYAPLAELRWQLRESVTTYDGVHVALAELLDAPLATLDQPLAAAPGPRCDFTTPA